MNVEQLSLRFSKSIKTKIEQLKVNGLKSNKLQKHRTKIVV